jgi:hypothetical protein
MYNLDNEIREWRRKMADSGLNRSEILDELEGHLREGVQHHLEAGLEPRVAFEQEVRRFGEPDELWREFRKVPFGGTGSHVRSAILALAGIPVRSVALANPAGSSRYGVEPAWATYLRTAMFVAPAICLWVFCVVFLFPRFLEVCARAGLVLPSILNFVLLINNYGAFLCAALVLVLGLLEWRVKRWGQLRRAAMSVAAFILNSAVLVFFAALTMWSLLAASGLATPN